MKFFIVIVSYVRVHDMFRARIRLKLSLHLVFLFRLDSQ